MMNKPTDLLHTIKADTIAAIKRGEKDVVTILRLAQSEINQLPHQNKPVAINDDSVQQVLLRMIKKIKESILMFQSEGLEDHVKKAQQEMAVLNRYLPPELDEKTLDAMIKTSIEETGANSIKNMGQVIAHIKGKTGKARADWQLVSSKVKQYLSDL